MKDLNLLFETAKHNVESLGVEIGNIKSIEPNNRAKSRWGQCKIYKNNNDWNKRVFTININNRLLQDDIKDEKVMSVIIHEILHTCRGCFNHGELWKRYADLINDCYSCYKIERTQSCSYFGINKEDYRAESKYEIVCGHCGYSFYRNRKFDTNRYLCGRCRHSNWIVYTNY